MKNLKNITMETNRTELYNQWVDKVCQYIEEVGPKLNLPGSVMQSRPVLDRQPGVVFLGFNSHEEWGYCGLKRERFFDGNPFFYENRMSETWKVWKRPYEAFKSVNYLNPMTDGNYVFMNAVYFGSKDIKTLKATTDGKEAIDRCLDFTEEVIQNVFKPKCVVCFSQNDCFAPLRTKFKFGQVETVTPTNFDGQPAKKTVIKGLWNSIPVYGIPHPSGRINYDDWGGIALYLKKEMEQLGV